MDGPLSGFIDIYNLCRDWRLEDANFLVGDMVSEGKLGRWDGAYSAGYVSGYRQALQDLELARRGRRRSPRTP